MPFKRNSSLTNPRPGRPPRRDLGKRSRAGIEGDKAARPGLWSSPAQIDLDIRVHEEPDYLVGEAQPGRGAALVLVLTMLLLIGGALFLSFWLP